MIMRMLLVHVPCIVLGIGRISGLKSSGWHVKWSTDDWATDNWAKNSDEWVTKIWVGLGLQLRCRNFGGPVDCCPVGVSPRRLAIEYTLLVSWLGVVIGGKNWDSSFICCVFNCLCLLIVLSCVFLSVSVKTTSEMTNCVELCLLTDCFYCVCLKTTVFVAGQWLSIQMHCAFIVAVRTSWKCLAGSRQYVLTLWRQDGAVLVT